MRGIFGHKGLRRAFTLIELLVVVAIIGILATVVVINVSSARTKAMAAKIKSDVSQAVKAAAVCNVGGGTVNAPQQHGGNPVCNPSDASITDHVWPALNDPWAYNSSCAVLGNLISSCDYRNGGDPPNPITPNGVGDPVVATNSCTTTPVSPIWYGGGAGYTLRISGCSKAIKTVTWNMPDGNSCNIANSTSCSTTVGAPPGGYTDTAKVTFDDNSQETYTWQVKQPFVCTGNPSSFMVSPVSTPYTLSFSCTGGSANSVSWSVSPSDLDLSSCNNKSSCALPLVWGSGALHMVTVTPQAPAGQTTTPISWRVYPLPPD